MNSINELEQAKFLSVSALNRYLAYRFEHDDNLNNVYLEGEISNLKYSGGHLYFSLKDQDSEISAIMFANNVKMLNFEPVDGILVQAVGKVGIYQKRGTYSITIRMMIQKGVGILYQQFLELKKKLDEEGLFLDVHKKKLPIYPKTIGIITSATGEAINDITSTINRRYPLVKLVLYPALVQGLDAPKDLIRALDLAYKNKDLDLIIIGRGGGSFEDLSCFNDEELARKLFLSPVPTISAVGHQGDYTIVDFIASVRAATPTAAALIAVRDKQDIMQDISHLSQNLKSNFSTYLIHLEKNLKKYSESYVLTHFDEYLDRYLNRFNVLFNKLKQYSPEAIIQNRINLCDNYKSRLCIAYENNLKEKQLYFDLLNTKMKNGFNNLFNVLNTNFNHLKQKLDLLNPYNLMDKGYALTYQDGNVISSVKDLRSDKDLIIRYKDGIVKSKILKIDEEQNGK